MYKTQSEINKRRKEIEKEVAELLKQSCSDFTLDDVKDAIYEEEDNDDMTKIISMFDSHGLDGPELSDVLEMVTDAWNHFPHEALNGLSPAEKLLEYEKSTKNNI
jgi:argonaute-like protein implicated in RNA metabolism and viral defense